jgi:hypothetical protein
MLLSDNGIPRCPGLRPSNIHRVEPVSRDLTPFDSSRTEKRVVTPLFGSFGFVRFPSPAPVLLKTNALQKINWSQLKLGASPIQLSAWPEEGAPAV